MRQLGTVFLPLVLGALGRAPQAAAAPTFANPQPIVLRVDAREAPRMMLHVNLRVPARPGALTLVYPKWIPGTHGPTGKVADIAGLRMSTGGKALAWRRDPVEFSEFSVTVPAGATALDVELDVVVDTRWGATADVSDVNWNRVVLYPKGARAHDVRVDAGIRVPEGWHYATALRSTSADAGLVTFAPVSLETLVDSPLIMGRYGRAIDLGHALGAEHRLEVVAAKEGALAANEKRIAALQRVVAEGTALFGARHYGDRYTFLLTLNCGDGSASGLEHHASSQNCESEDFLTGDDALRAFPWILPHEFAHSWSGKYRRPRGLATPDFQQPTHNELLWVYEGMTEYFGWLLVARSGWTSVQDAKDWLAMFGQMLDAIPARRWRPVGDTVFTPAMGPSNRPWYSAQRNLDFLREGLFIWLEADTVIRQKTGGQRSLDDFARAFFGGANTAPEVKPYDLRDVLDALGKVAPHDWKGFFEQRVSAVSPHAALGGIEAGGYKLTYRDKPSEHQVVFERTLHTTLERASIGMVVDGAGHVTDVHLDGPAGRAGLVLGMTLVAVNGRKYSADVLRRAIAENKGKPSPIELLTERDGVYRTLPVTWSGGARYPHLERDPAKPDGLGAILAPRAPLGTKRE